VRVTVTANGPRALKAYAGKLTDAIDGAVANTAYAIENDARSLAPEDTGALKASLYTLTFKGMRGKQARAEARAAVLRKGVKFLAPGVVPKLGEAYVVAGVDYAAIVNDTHKSKRFFMEKALRKNAPTLRRNLERAVRGIR
jgi:hypothetical protein